MLGEVGPDAAAAQGGDVDLVAPARAGDPPGPELCRELEGVLAELTRYRPRRRLRVAADGDVEVGHLAAEGGVADGAADDPGLGIAESIPHRHEQRCLVQAPHAARRRTRAEIAQVTS